MAVHRRLIGADQNLKIGTELFRQLPIYPDVLQHPRLSLGKFRSIHRARVFRECVLIIIAEENPTVRPKQRPVGVLKSEVPAVIRQHTVRHPNHLVALKEAISQILVVLRKEMLRLFAVPLRKVRRPAVFRGDSRNRTSAQKGDIGEVAQ